MYDAKKIEQDEKKSELQWDCVAARSYFYKPDSETMLNLKNSHIPTETVLGPK